MDGDRFPGVSRKPSAGSKAGRHYVGAGPGDKILNRGEKTFRARRSKEAATHKMTFQDAPVRKALAAVSGVTSQGNGVWFDNDREESCIMPGNCPEMAQIRKLVKQVRDRITLELKKGVYVMPMWVQTRDDEGAGKPEGFARQGR